ncbi:MAG: DUF4870 family protein [Gammaproteobacteria bacterium]
MSENNSQPDLPPEISGKMKTLKNIAAVVYLCQVLAFGFFGIPLLIGVALNVYKKEDVQGTWLESHFNWQIKTAYIVLALLAVSGLTLDFGLGIFVLLGTVIWLVYRIGLGWYALNANQPIGEK